MKEIVLSVKRQKTEIKIFCVCIALAYLMNIISIISIRYKLVRALDTIVVDAAHHVWLLRVVGCTPSAVLRTEPVEKVIVAFLLEREVTKEI